MSNVTLMQLYAQHKGKGSDKWSIYLQEYSRIFDAYRERPVSILEIGIQNGGSLEIWSKFFTNAKGLVGCDINPECAKLAYNDQRISIVIGDANSDNIQKAVLARSPVFDVILDDGSHRSSDIIKSFAKYFPHLADGGLFVIEDLHCSYWAEFEGGLFDPFSSIAFFKRLADIINWEHWGIDKTPSDILNGFFLKYGFAISEDVLTHIHSIEFINSMCVIRKQAPDINLLGKRIFTGTNESVVLHDDAAGLEKWTPPDQTANTWTEPPDEKSARLHALLDKRDAEIAELKAKTIEQKGRMTKLLNERDAISAERDAIVNSTSWRLTRPLRLISHSIKRVFGKAGI